VWGMSMGGEICGGGSVRENEIGLKEKGRMGVVH